jgi:haloalkane dehalogenase
MAIIRTPDERFENLSGYPFKPNYVEINGMRMHYVDEGEGEVVLCLHGEPSWSYLYRKMIPILSEKNRVIAPDFIGFGKSDKFTEIPEYSYAAHRDSIISFIEILGLERITIVVQDWGGLLGLRVVSMIPSRFIRLVVMNTGLPTGEGPLPEAFNHWRKFVEETEDLPIGEIMQKRFLNLDAQNPIGTGADLPDEVVAAYEAPFPSIEYKAGAKAFPLMVPQTTDDEAAPELKAAQEFLPKWGNPALTLFSDQDPITKGGDVYFRFFLPTAKEQPEITIKGASHFLQEDAGEEVAGHIQEFIERTPM